jgi:hypothetical protein
LCRSSSRVDKEPAEHVHVAERAEGLAGRAEFDVVVWRGRGRGQQPVGHLAHEVGHERTALTVERLDRAGLVAHRAAEPLGVEQVQAIIVRDRDPTRDRPVTGHGRVNPELLSLVLRLEGDGQRRDD